MRVGVDITTAVVSVEIVIVVVENVIITINILIYSAVGVIVVKEATLPAKLISQHKLTRSNCIS